MAKTSEGNETAKEQIRGLYVIGLLAVLVAVKLSSQLDPVADVFFVYVIANWVGYSFCMVFAYLDLHNSIFEISAPTSERIASFSKKAGEVFLVVSLIASIIFVVAYFWYVFLLMILVIGICAAIYYPAWVLWRHFKTSRKKKDVG
jgi:hypothetical protein